MWRNRSEGRHLEVMSMLCHPANVESFKNFKSRMKITILVIPVSLRLGITSLALEVMPSPL